MRKRNFVCGITLCLALSMAGCGKSSEEQQAVNYYQNELGLDKEEAEELARELYGKDEEEKEPSVTEAPKETVIEPLPELLDSEWYDRKVQIYDMVFNYAYMTEEDIRKIVEESTSDVELREGFDQNGEVKLESLWVDESNWCSLYKRTYDSDAKVVKYGLHNEGDYYEVQAYYGVDCWYDKSSIEFAAFKTRDDVLVYLIENGFVEVEKEQAPYVNYVENYGGQIFPDKTPVEFADVPHYYCKGAQSITLFRIHKLGETDQVIENSGHHYSGSHLNLVNYVTFKFNTDGTIDVSTKINKGNYYAYNKECKNQGLPGWYLPDLYDMEHCSREVEIMGEQID